MRPEMLLLMVSLDMEDSCWEQRLRTGGAYSFARVFFLPLAIHFRVCCLCMVLELCVCVCVCDGCSVSVVQEVSVLHQPSCDGWHHHALSEDHECTHLSQRCQKGEAEFMKEKKNS